MPLIGWDGAAPAAAAEDLIPGVLGIAEDGGHPAETPSGGRVGGRVGGWVGVQPRGDGVDAELVIGAPGVDLRHDGGPVRVQHQAGFSTALSGFERVRVRHPVREVPVGDGANIPPFGGVFLEPFPCFFLELQPEPFGDTLLDPPDENGGRADPGEIGRLIGGKQQDPLIG